MRKIRPILLGIITVTLMLTLPGASMAEFEYHHNGMALGVGINQATDNDADESFAFGVKFRSDTFAGGLDYCKSEGPGGEGSTSFMFPWVAWMEEFSRPPESTYDLYGGLGVGYMILEDEEFIDSPFGPFVITGWDMGEELTLEGKVGVFGGSFWGTAMVYWNM